MCVPCVWDVPISSIHWLVYKNVADPEEVGMCFLLQKTASQLWLYMPWHLRDVQYWLKSNYWAAPTLKSSMKLHSIYAEICYFGVRVWDVYWSNKISGWTLKRRRWGMWRKTKQRASASYSALQGALVCVRACVYVCVRVCCGCLCILSPAGPPDQNRKPTLPPHASLFLSLSFSASPPPLSLKTAALASN